ncbi:hypothetical protein ACH5RR_026527 [Cinchona calisaya]|uniref:Carboxypeptidase n=1 Tax=Cinchona calisaya TaxID=153742 RepID=A0ABD2Z686_9GENT
MGMEWWWLWELVVIVGLMVGGNVYPKEDSGKVLHGQPKVGFKQYAGYIDVDVKAGRSLFYYFVEAEKDPNQKPLALWLNGGPGCSSMGGGAFTEVGPFFPRGDGRGLRRNKMSWNRASNPLFVESPAGVGWSYSNTSSDYNTDDVSTAQDMHTFMVEWFKKFPSFRSRDLFLTGESYAGHYIPQFAIVLLDHNAYSKDFKFNIKGVAFFELHIVVFGQIGNPLLKPDRDVPAIYEFFWSHGMISDEVGHTIMNNCNFEDYTFPSPHNVTKACISAMSEAYGIVGDYINNYDVILDATKISLGVDICMTYERRFYFTLPEVQMALHANRTNLPYSWSMWNDNLDYSEADGNLDMLPSLKKIIQNGIPIWIFRGAAHMVPYAQTSRALHLFSSFVRGRRLPNTAQPLMDDSDQV